MIVLIIITIIMIMVQVRVTALILHQLRSELPKMGGRDRKQRELIAGLEDVFYKARSPHDLRAISARSPEAHGRGHVHGIPGTRHGMLSCGR